MAKLFVFVASMWVLLAGCVSNGSLRRDDVNRTGSTAFNGACNAFLSSYCRYSDSPVNLESPFSYIKYVKGRPETKCNLNDIPENGIILYYANTVEMLNLVGISPAEYESCEIGTTTPSQLFIVRPKEGKPFVVNRGLPGAGGVATQVAELGALGVRNVVHVGTAGLLGMDLADNIVILSGGSYKDAASYLMPGGSAKNSLAFPDTELNQRLRDAFVKNGPEYADAVGYTIPIIYYQPRNLIEALILGKEPLNGPVPKYLEMEEAPFFTSAAIAKVKAASVVVPSDRAVLTKEGLTGAIIPFKSQLAAAFKQVIGALGGGSHSVLQMADQGAVELQCVKNELYAVQLIFGLSSDDGNGVSEQQWDDYVKTVISKSFPGSTTVNSLGRYYDEDKNSEVMERSKIIMLVVNCDEKSEKALLSAISVYRNKFKQNSVLRINLSGQVKFYDK